MMMYDGGGASQMLVMEESCETITFAVQTLLVGATPT